MKIIKLIVLHLILFFSLYFLVPRIFSAPNSLVTEIYITITFLSICGYLSFLWIIKNE